MGLNRAIRPMPEDFDVGLDTRGNTVMLKHETGGKTYCYGFVKSDDPEINSRRFDQIRRHIWLEAEHARLYPEET